MVLCTLVGFRILTLATETVVATVKDQLCDIIRIAFRRQAVPSSHVAEKVRCLQRSTLSIRVELCMRVSHKGSEDSMHS